MKNFLLLPALLALGAAASAQIIPAADTFPLTGDIPFTNKYVFRGLQQAGDSVQPSVELDYGDYYGGVFTNLPLSSGRKDEVDFYAARSLAVPELGSGWRCDLGGYAYDYPQGYYVPGLSDTSFEAYTGLAGGKIAGGLMPSLYAYYDFTRQTYTIQGALRGSVPLKAAGLSLDGQLTVGYVGADRSSDADHESNYTYWGAGVSVPYQFTARAKFTVGAQYNSSDLTGVAHNLFTYSAGVTFTF
jgi:uncharacterized protein (TIGR02001 family)